MSESTTELDWITYYINKRQYKFVNRQTGEDAPIFAFQHKISYWTLPDWMLRYLGRNARSWHIDKNGSLVIRYMQPEYTKTISPRKWVILEHTGDLYALSNKFFTRYYERFEISDNDQKELASYDLHCSTQQD